MTYFSGSKVFGCFEKHPKVVSGALRGGFRAREVFGSFEKRTPGEFVCVSKVTSAVLLVCERKYKKHKLFGRQIIPRKETIVSY